MLKAYLSTKVIYPKQGTNKLALYGLCRVELWVDVQPQDTTLQSIISKINVRGITKDVYEEKNTGTCLSLTTYLYFPH